MRRSWDSTAARPWFDAVVGSLVIHYLRDWVAPLRELRRVLTPEGVLVLSTHHPAADVKLSASGNYLAIELLHDHWEKGGRVYEVSFWRRPLSAMFAAFAEAGFDVDTLSGPQPLPECEACFPDAWKRLTTQPNFVFFRLKIRR